MAARSTLGALTPISTDSHYSFATPLFRWTRNLRNYLPRTLPSPVAMLAIVGLPWATSAARRGLALIDAKRTKALLLFAVAWFLLLILPVVPIVARSELYLYLPGFGFCVLAGYVTNGLFEHRTNRWLAHATVIVLVACLGGYQMSRAAGIQERLRLSDNLVDAVRDCSALRRHTGPVVLVPENKETRQALRDATGNYLQAVLQTALERIDVTGTVAPVGTLPPPAEGELRLLCRRQGSDFLLRANLGARR